MLFQGYFLILGLFQGYLIRGVGSGGVRKGFHERWKLTVAQKVEMIPSL